MILGKNNFLKVERDHLQKKELGLKYEGDQMITFMIPCENNICECISFSLRTKHTSSKYCYSVILLLYLLGLYTSIF